MSKDKAKHKKELIKRLADVRVVAIACKQVGISRATFYRWQNEDSDFSCQCDEAIEQGTDQISDLAESQIITKIKEGDFRASTYWLEHHHSDYTKKASKKNERDEFSSFTKKELDAILKDNFDESEEN